MMRVSAGYDGKKAGQHEYDGLAAVEKGKTISPDLERLSRKEGVDYELIRRAQDREDEERDLRVLDAYNRFEAGLMEILTAPGNGVMQRQAGEAQSAVFEVNDYFSEEGGRLRDELPDDECRERFMDILESRRRTAINAVSRHQSKEYQNWKERTASETIDSVLRAVNVCPDVASLMHGERLLEGAVLRLYRGCNPELLQMRLATAKQAMYCGALESIGNNDPVTALILCESWKEQVGENNYDQLREKYIPLARNQSLKQEFNSLRNLEEAEIEAELDDITDAEMRRELSEMLSADRKVRESHAAKAEEERVNIISRELFRHYTEDSLTMETIIDSGLPSRQKSLWRVILSRKLDSGNDKSLIAVVEAVIEGRIREEYQIYSAIAGGLGETDASMLASLFGLRSNPEAPLILNGLREISECRDSAGGDESDYAAAVRDYLHRLIARISEKKVFSVTALRNEVIDDHFGGGRFSSAKQDCNTGAGFDRSEAAEAEFTALERAVEPDCEE